MIADMIRGRLLILADVIRGQASGAPTVPVAVTVLPMVHGLTPSV